MRRIPVVGSLYSSVKQVSDTLFSSQRQRVPQGGAGAVSARGFARPSRFLTGMPGGDVLNHLTGDYVSVYVPTTPNPTSGFFLMMPRSEVIELDMTVDAALKYIVSMGVVAPERAAAPERLRAAPPSRRCNAGTRREHAFRARAVNQCNNERQTSCRCDTQYCGLVTEALLGQTVTLCGWVHRRRDHGGVIFIDLRDREGLVQVVCDPDRAEMFKVAEGVRNEFCLRVKGVVRARPEGTANAEPDERQDRSAVPRAEVLNPSVTPPFQLDDDNLSETTRLTHRVLDLRRPQMQNNLSLRYTRDDGSAQVPRRATASSTSRRRC